MIRTEPQSEPVDPLDLQFGYPRGHADRPWVMANFVTTVDGATAVNGSSTAINDEDDMAMFRAIRAVADFIVVGAGTVRAETYGPVVLDESRRQRRLEAGLEATPHLVIISGSMNLDPGARVFSDPEHRATVLTGDDGPAPRFADLSEVADVVRLGDLSALGIVHYLRMAKVVLCEGGPNLMGQFVSADLVDELAWTVAPLLASGDSPRMAHGANADPPVEMRLDRVLYGERSLFLRYVRS